MKRVVLEAHMLVSFFEDGADAEHIQGLIEHALAGKRELFLDAINLGELRYCIWKKRGQQAADRAVAGLSQLPITQVDVDPQLALSAAGVAASRGVSNSLAVAAALARVKKAMLAVRAQDACKLVDEVPLAFAGQEKQ